MIKDYLKKIPFLPGIYRKTRKSFQTAKSNFKKLFELIAFDTHNINRTILFVGSGRSGTTWISNLLNHTNQYRYIFEPFAETTNEMAIFGSQPYVISQDINKKDLKTKMGKILSGKSKSTKWVNKFNNKHIANKRIIKGIRIHFILGWIIESFPQIKVVYLMRHPFPSSLSKTNLDWNWKTGNYYVENPILFEKYLKPFADVIKSADTEFLDNVVGWCVENYVALQQLDGKSFLLIYYEDFCIAPEKATREMTDYTGAPFDKEKFLHRVKEEFIITENSAIMTKNNLVLNWIDKVSPTEIESAMGIVKAFGLEEYYNENPYPLKSHIIDKD